jgi:hypothetical protein
VRSLGFRVGFGWPRFFNDGSITKPRFLGMVTIWQRQGVRRHPYKLLNCNEKIEINRPVA